MKIKQVRAINSGRFTDIKKHVVALKKLDKHKPGVGRLYINKLEDIDIKVLKGMIEVSSKTGFFGK